MQSPFQSVLGRPPAPFAKPTVSWPAPNFHLEVSFPYRALRATHQDRVSTLSDRALREPYPAGYGFPSPFGSRHSLLDPSLSRWGFGPSSRSAYCRSVEPLSDRPHRGLHVPHEGDAVGVGAFFTPRSSVFLSRSRPQTPVRVRPLIIVSTRLFR